MEWYKRGALVKTGWQMRAFKGWAGGRSLELAGLAVGPADETKHFKFIGTTGTGKSTAITELLEGALERGDRAVFADPDGGYLARFRDRAEGMSSSILSIRARSNGIHLPKSKLHTMSSSWRAGSSPRPRMHRAASGGAMPAPSSVQ
jgi:DNA helicase HerA-like ATPase